MTNTTALRSGHEAVNVLVPESAIASTITSTIASTSAPIIARIHTIAFTFTVAILLSVGLVPATFSCLEAATLEPTNTINPTDLVRPEASINSADTTDASDAIPIEDFQSLRAYATPDLVQVLVEIAAGSNEKWEVNSETGVLEWDRVNGEKRIIQYLPYPWNYGMIPGTLLREEEGGDGDPLDVILLGARAERGALVSGRVVGVMVMTDRGEQDDKILAVRPDGIFSEVFDVEGLDERFPGVLDITRLWLMNYKGASAEVVVNEVLGAEAAVEILSRAIPDSSVKR